MPSMKRDTRQRGHNYDPNEQHLWPKNCAFNLLD